MKIENQVVSLELAKKLEDLGVKQESHFWWIQQVDEIPVPLHLPTEVPTDSWVLLDRKGRAESVSAFTVAELGEMLPWIIDLDEETAWLETTKNGPKCEIAKTYSVCYSTDSAVENPENTEVFSEDNEADARAKMLIYLIENGLAPQGKEKVKIQDLTQ